MQQKRINTKFYNKTFYYVLIVQFQRTEFFLFYFN